MRCRWPRSPARRGAALLLLALVVGASAATAEGHTTVASVYLPEYHDSDWEALRGSILTKVGTPRHNVQVVLVWPDPDAQKNRITP